MYIYFTLYGEITVKMTVFPRGNISLTNIAKSRVRKKKECSLTLN